MSRGGSFSLPLLFAGGDSGPSNSLKGMSIFEQFQLFRDLHPIVHRIVSGNDWSYIAAGAGDRTVVILPGGGGDAESMFPVVSGLEQRCRVVAIGYPPTAARADEIVDGVRTILDDCGVRHACLLGHSLGGFAAQALARRYPDRVDSLIIANSAVYSPGRMRLFRVLLPVMARLPHRVMARAVRSAFQRLLKGDPDREFWMYYVNQCAMMDSRSKGLRNQVLCMLDFLKDARAARAPAGGWNGRVLILESDHETGFTPRERRSFRMLYPNAAVHVFSNAGHLSFITHTGEFVGTVGDFLAVKETCLCPGPRGGVLRKPA